MNLLFFPVALVLCAGFGALGYLWFGVFEWTTLPGQISFGAASLAYLLGWVWILPRLPIHRKPRPQAAIPYRPVASAAALQQWEAKKAKRIAGLRADPAKHKYLERAEIGDLITDFEIAYLEDPTRTLTCQHLRGVEAAMRAEGIELRPHMDNAETFSNTVDCCCAVDMSKLKRRFALPDCVAWDEFVEFRYEAAWGSAALCASRASRSVCLCAMDRLECSRPGNSSSKEPRP